MNVVMKNLLCFIILLFSSIFSENLAMTDEEYMLFPPGSKFLVEKSPPNKPSVLLSPEEDKKIHRGIYGGKLDKPHLGGFTVLDPMGISNNSFNYMAFSLGIKSIIDVGCGKGISTSYFQDRGMDVLCVEGSHDAVTQTLLPKEKVIEHDFTRGPWWPDRTFDASWSVEFLEHIGRQYMDNYLPVFHKSALIFATATMWGGWHHVEVHHQIWWKARMTAQGFIYSPDLTQDLIKYAKADKTPTGTEAQHIRLTGMVFINPKVASLPQHRHLFSGNGCFSGTEGNTDGGVPCVGSDALPKEYEPNLSCNIDPKNKLMCQKNERAV